MQQQNISANNNNFLQQQAINSSNQNSSAQNFVGVRYPMKKPDNFNALTTQPRNSQAIMTHRTQELNQRFARNAKRDINYANCQVRYTPYEGKQNSSASMKKFIQDDNDHISVASQSES